MYQIDFDDFRKILGDLCVSVNRPFNDDLARVFWEDLKNVHLSEVRERAKYLRSCGKSRFTANDLKPEKPAAVVNTYTPPDPFDNFHRFGQRCLMKFLLSAKEQISPEMVQELNEHKSRLVCDFREMHKETQDVTAEQMREALFTAFGRVVG